VSCTSASHAAQAAVKLYAIQKLGRGAYFQALFLDRKAYCRCLVGIDENGGNAHLP
jgi:hypothetical protein